MRTLTTTEAAVLALLALAGEQSGYDLLKQMSSSIGHACSGEESALHAQPCGRPVDAARQQLYELTAAGRAALDGWLETVVPGDEQGFDLKLFVGGLTTHEG